MPQGGGVSRNNDRRIRDMNNTSLSPCNDPLSGIGGNSVIEISTYFSFSVITVMLCLVTLILVCNMCTKTAQDTGLPTGYVPSSQCDGVFYSMDCRRSIRN